MPAAPESESISRMYFLVIGLARQRQSMLEDDHATLRNHVVAELKVSKGRVLALTSLGDEKPAERPGDVEDDDGNGTPACARATSVTGSPPIGLPQSAGGDSPPGQRAHNRARPEPSATSCAWRARLSAGPGDELDRDRVGILACRENGEVHVLVEVQEHHARRVMADSHRRTRGFRLDW
jgi:hypothetical protein